MKKLIAHADDGLVLSGWNPGEGRKLPPMSHERSKKPGSPGLQQVLMPQRKIKIINLEIDYHECK